MRLINLELLDDREDRRLIVSNNVLLEIKGLQKSFPGIKVLDDINIDFKKGNVHAVIGENGAGKSTLMNILFGYLQAEGGKLFWNGKDVKIHSPIEAQKMGISMIHQENSLIPFLSVMDNIYLGHYPRKAGFIKKQELQKKVEGLLKELDISDIEPSTIVEKLSVAQKQLIEIVKALSINPKLIMMDEPTAALTTKETSTLMGIINKLRDNDVSIIYVSHRLEEVFEISDEISVLRDGLLVVTKDTEDITINEAVAFMVGRDLGDQMQKMQSSHDIGVNGEEILRVENFNLSGKFEDINFDVKKGEILGFGGLVGAGRTELMEAIFGFMPQESGKVFIKGKEVKIKSPLVAVKQGIAMVPEERKVKGVFGDLDVADNINIVSLKKFTKAALINKKKEVEAAEKYIELLNIMTTSRKKLIYKLSGGNQQKTILARWLQTEPEILILDEPTHGIDVGAKAEIYKIIKELSDKGLAILLISSELPELLMLSDRIVVMQNGKINGIIDADEFSQKNIMMYATGQKKANQI